jgi:hypothetical protein
MIWCCGDDHVVGRRDDVLGVAAAMMLRAMM